MLRVYRGWLITPIKSDTLIAQKGRMTLTGEWEDLVVAIDTHEKQEEKEQMHVIYRGWMVHKPAHCEPEYMGVTTAKKGNETIKGRYENVIKEIDRIEFKKKEDEL